MNCIGTYCILLVVIVKFLVELCSFACVCVLCNISKKNPFEDQLIDNLSNYFISNDEININNSTINNKYNKIFINRVNIENHIINESKKISSDLDINKRIFLRKLVSNSFCSEMYDNFEKYRGTQLSNIFDLNYDKIHKYSIITLILSVVNFIGKILIRTCVRCVDQKSDNNCLIFICAIFVWIIIFLDAIELVCFTLMFYFMEKGDLEKYANFLECKNVNANFFKNITDVNNIRVCFFIFVTMKFISVGIEKIGKNLENIEKEVKNGCSCC